MKKQSKSKSTPRPLLIAIEKLEKKVSGASVPVTTCWEHSYCSGGN